MKPHEKPIFFEGHARRRMAQRGITDEEVRDTLRKPHSVGPAERENAKRFERSFSPKRRIVVIAEVTPAYVLVVSTWKK